MKNQFSLRTVIIFALLLLANGVPVFGQGSAFTFQGRLQDAAGPANGSYDLRFGLFHEATGGEEAAGTIQLPNVAVTNGLFTVSLDFGGSVFNGSSRWLEIGVRTNGSADAYSTLSPRTEITSAPYAIRAAGVYASGIAEKKLRATVSPRYVCAVAE